MKTRPDARDARIAELQAEVARLSVKLETISEQTVLIASFGQAVSELLVYLSAAVSNDLANLRASKDILGFGLKGRRGRAALQRRARPAQGHVSRPARRGALALADLLQRVATLAAQLGQVATNTAPIAAGVTVDREGYVALIARLRAIEAQQAQIVSQLNYATS